MFSQLGLIPVPEAGQHAVVVAGDQQRPPTGQRGQRGVEPEPRGGGGDPFVEVATAERAGHTRFMALAALVAMAPGIIGYALIYQGTRVLFAADSARSAASATAVFMMVSNSMGIKRPRRAWRRRRW